MKFFCYFSGVYCHASSEPEATVLFHHLLADRSLTLQRLTVRTDLDPFRNFTTKIKRQRRLEWLKFGQKFTAKCFTFENVDLIVRDYGIYSSPLLLE